MSENRNEIVELPASLEIEEDILGTCLQEGSVWWRKVEQAAEGIDLPDLFFDSDHRTVAKAMTAVYNNNTPITVSSVTDELLLNRESQSLVPTPKLYLTTLQSVATLRSPDDVAGAAKKLVESYRLREMIVALKGTITKASVVQPNPNEIASELRQIASDQSMMTTDIKTFGEQIAEAEALNGMAVTVRASTGITSVDNLLHGGHGSGSFTVIAARPKVGKTTVILNSILSNLADGQVVVFASLELGYKELYSKMLSSQSMVPQKELAEWLDGKRKYTEFSEEEQEAIDEASSDLRSAFLYTLYSRDITHGADSIIAAAWQAKQRHPDKDIIVYIDYIQLMVEGAANRQAEIGQVARKLKIFAQEIDGPVIVAAQVSRDAAKDGDDGMPKPHHLRESGDLEQTADTVIMLNRKALQDESFPPHVMDVWVALARNGEPGFRQAYYRPQIQFVCDLEEATELMASSSGDDSPRNEADGDEYE